MKKTFCDLCKEEVHSYSDMTIQNSEFDRLYVTIEGHRENNLGNTTKHDCDLCKACKESAVISWADAIKELRNFTNTQQGD